MRTSWIWAVILVAGCIESNPQPSPGGGSRNEGGEDTVVAAEDTWSAADVTSDTSASDSTLDLPPLDAVCVPACEGKECGSDGCDGVCGDCPDNQVCEEDLCVGTCQPGDPCCSECFDHTDCVDVFSGEELGACSEPKCQYDMDCQGWQCAMVPVDDPFCCDAVQDCLPSNGCLDVECVQNHCEYSKIPGCCAVPPQTLFVLDFDDLTPGEQPSPIDFNIEDKNPQDNVSWTAQETTCGGGMAMYLGDPLCGTYYNGDLWDCQPMNEMDCASDSDCPGDSTCMTDITFKCSGSPAMQVEFQAEVPEVLLPADSLVALFFTLRTDLEPQVLDEFLFDSLRLYVEYTPNPEPFGPPVEVEVHAAPQSTEGECVTFAADLSLFAPFTCPGCPLPSQTSPLIKLIWRFDTLDGALNHFPGLWLDDIRVETYCEPCATPTDCDDDDACTADACIEPVFGIIDGLCYHAPEPGGCAQ